MFDKFWHWLMVLPALAIPMLVMNMQHKPAEQKQNVAVTSPAPAGPRAVVKRSPTPSPTPVKSAKPATPKATPKPSPAVAGAATVRAALGKTEMASEQVCPGQGDVSKTTSVLVCLTTNARMFHGLGAVKANSALMAAAAAKDQDMLKCGYSHTACGRPFTYWIAQKGYSGRCSAENIAMGQRTPREVFAAWMNSAGHRANILGKDYRDIGVAALASPKGTLWTMQLGGC